MKVSGLPKEHLQLIAELETMEAFFMNKDLLSTPEIIAQSLTCLAHDWIQLGLEEKGHELLLKADKICPGYHKNKMLDHMKQDPSYDTLVKSLANELVLVALSTARDNNLERFRR